MPDAGAAGEVAVVAVVVAAGRMAPRRGRTRAGARPSATDAGRVDVDIDVEDEEDERASRRRAAGPADRRPSARSGIRRSARRSAPAANLVPLDDDEDFDEPEIPEYLIAEQRRGGARAAPVAGRRPRRWRPARRSCGATSPRWSASATAAVGAAGSTAIPTSAAGPAAGGGGGGEGSRSAGPRASRDPEPRRARGGRRGSAEPWSEVPPELEAMLRAQVTQARRPDRPRRSGPGRARSSEAPTVRGGDRRRGRIAPTPARDRGGTRQAAPTRSATAGKATTADDLAGRRAAAAPKRRTTRDGGHGGDRRAGRRAGAEAADHPQGGDRRVVDRAGRRERRVGRRRRPSAAPKRRTTRRTTTRDLIEGSWTAHGRGATPPRSLRSPR